MWRAKSRKHNPTVFDSQTFPSARDVGEAADNTRLGSEIAVGKVVGGSFRLGSEVAGEAFRGSTRLGSEVAGEEFDDVMICAGE